MIPDIPDGILELTEFGNGTLSFSVNIHPMATPTLTRWDGAAVSTARVKIAESSIVFSKVHRSDAGVYILGVTSRGFFREVSTRTTISLIITSECGVTIQVNSLHTIHVLGLAVPLLPTSGEGEHIL